MTPAASALARSPVHVPLDQLSDGYNEQVTLAVAGTYARYRRASGFTLAEMAAVVGIGVPTLSNYELGKTTLTLGRFAELCAALRIDPAEVLAEAMATVVPVRTKHKASRMSRLRARLQAALRALAQAQEEIDAVVVELAEV